MKKITYILLFIFITLNIKAQVTASFTPDKTEGCGTLAVVFTNTSTPATGATYNWNFGNGNASALKNPTASYTQPGTYTVTLTVTVGAQSDQTTQTIHVYRFPQANYTSGIHEACGNPGLSVAFQNTTTLGDAPIDSYKWVFGTGVSSTQENPTYNYPTYGKYDVLLEVIDDNGCRSTKSIPQYVKISDVPTVTFTANITQTCNNPAAITFSNTSEGNSFTWDFGDDGASTDKNPTHLYTQLGTYTVSLIANDNGCENTLTRNTYINVVETKANFTSADASCPNLPVAFTNTSTGSDTYSWTFGDGGTSTSQNPSHTYTSPGTYTVQLTSSINGIPTCVSTFSKTININDITANFSADVLYGCNPTLTVNFDDNSSPGVTYAWNFGDGSTSTTSGDVSHTYSKIGTFCPSLTVTNPNGCTSTKTLAPCVVLERPKPSFIADKDSGCMPLNVNFTNTSTDSKPIVSYLWDFGNGSTSTAQNPPVQVYNPDGMYIANLTIINNLGCTNTFTDTIFVGKPLPTDFTVDKFVICAFNDPVQFTNSNPYPQYPDLIWDWQLQDGNSYADQNPSHQFEDFGTWGGKFTINYNGCLNSIDKPDLVEVVGTKIDSIVADFSCSDPYNYSFKSGVQQANKIYWDFKNSGKYKYSTSLYNEGSEYTGLVNFNHTYLGSGGDSTVRVMTVNYECIDDPTKGDSCYYESNIIVKPRKISASFTVNDDKICVGESVTFTSTSIDVNTYSWTFGDTKTSALPSPSNIYTTKGQYTVDLKVTDVNGCTSTAQYTPITVYQAEAKFIRDKNLGCPNLPVNFTDNGSNSYLDATIVEWAWVFGDGNNQTNVNNNSVLNTYANVGSYNAVLTVKDSYNCTDTASRPINIVRPTAAYTIDDNKICLGDEITFTNTTNYTYNPLQYTWDFGDASPVSNDEDPKYTYTTDGYYNVSLTVFDNTDNFKCGSTYTLSELIRGTNASVHVIPQPAADFIADPLTANCYPVDIDFTDLSVSDYIVSWLWDYGNGITRTIQNPSDAFSFGNHTISLTVTTPPEYGCSNTMTKTDYIQITGPFAEFSISPDKICVGDEATFTIANKTNIKEYFLDYGNGEGKVGDMTPDPETINYAYSHPGILYPSLIIEDFNGCHPPPLSITLDVQEVIAGILIASNENCINPTTNNAAVAFSNTSTGSNSWVWDFGDGNTSTSFNPTNPYAAIGTYTVSLTSTNEIGCTDNTTTTITVRDYPPLNLNNDYFTCSGKPIQLVATPTNYTSYAWSPATYLDATNVSNPNSTPTNDITYTLTVTDEFGCTNSKPTSISVHNDYNVSASPADTSIRMGYDVNISSLADQLGVTYYWTPQTGLSCVDCPNPVASPVVTTDYIVHFTDTANCFPKTLTVHIDVDQTYTIAVPSGFTPNGDGNNDVIKVRGWGLQELYAFRIYNRWGEKLFETNDFDIGWDGTYKGKPQGVETYAYVVEALTFDGRKVTGKGYISLIR